MGCMVNWGRQGVNQNCAVVAQDFGLAPASGPVVVVRDQNSRNRGVCTGGSMCTRHKQQQKCVNTIFICKWEFDCPGFCSGGTMCGNKNDKAECVNAIFGCTWNCQAPMGGGFGGGYGGGNWR